MKLPQASAMCARIGDFAYLRVYSPRKDISKDALQYLKSIVIENYLEKVIDVKVPKVDHLVNNWRTSNNPEPRPEAVMLLTQLKRIKRKLNSDRIQIRVSDENKSIFLYVTEITNGYMMNVYLSDNVASSNEMFILRIEKSSDRTIAYNGTDTKWFLSKKYSGSDKLARERSKDIGFTGLNLNDLPLIIGALYSAIDYISDGGELTVPSYMQSELNLFKAVWKSIPEMDAATFIINSWLNNMHDESLQPDTYSKSDSELLDYIMPSDLNEYPLIDFSEKEWKFIIDYCDKNNMIDSDSHRIDILPYITNARYGCKFKMNIETTGSDVQLVTQILLIAEDELKVILSHHYGDRIVSAVINFINLKEFSMKNSMLNINKAVTFLKIDAMAASVDELYDESPLANSTPEMILGLAARVLKALIIIHDRPKRSKMIRCTKTESIQSGKKSSQTKSKVSYWRILKPVKEANEYIEKMSGTRRDVEYTLEEWPRVAHTRTYKSGKVVHISETSCHRRLPLAKKEVEIKL